MKKKILTLNYPLADLLKEKLLIFMVVSMYMKMLCNFQFLSSYTNIYKKNILVLMLDSSAEYPEYSVIIMMC